MRHPHVPVGQMGMPTCHLVRDFHEALVSFFWTVFRVTASIVMSVTGRPAKSRKIAPTRVALIVDPMKETPGEYNFELFRPFPPR